MSSPADRPQKHPYACAAMCCGVVPSWELVLVGSCQPSLDWSGDAPYHGDTSSSVVSHNTFLCPVRTPRVSWQLVLEGAG